MKTVLEETPHKVVVEFIGMVTIGRIRQVSLANIGKHFAFVADYGKKTKIMFYQQ